MSGHALIKPCFYKDVNGFINRIASAIGAIYGVGREDYRRYFGVM